MIADGERISPRELLDDALRYWERRRRWGVWLAGTVFALLPANCWIADEIYPYVATGGT